MWLLFKSVYHKLDGFNQIILKSEYDNTKWNEY